MMYLSGKEYFNLLSYHDFTQPFGFWISVLDYIEFCAEMCEDFSILEGGK